MTRFTDLGIERLKPRKKKFHITEGDGLYLQVSPRGKKTWYRYGPVAGRRKWIRLGEYPAMKLTDARAKNEEVKRHIDAGMDPANRETGALSFDSTLREVFLEWFDKATDKRGNPWSEGHKRNVHYMFKADVLPALGDKKMIDIRKRDIRLFLERVERRAPNQALQLFRRLSRLFNYAADRDIIEVSPMVSLDPIGSTSKKDRYLSDDEIRAFLTALPAADMAPNTATILELILRTGQRPSEVAGAHIGEMRGDWWVIPGNRTKNGLEHRVFMTEKVKSLFGVANRHGYFFPSLMNEAKPVAHTILSKALRRSLTGKEKRPGKGETAPTVSIPVSPPFSPHDLRRTAATGLAGLGFSQETIGAVLNHKQRSVTGEHYVHYRYDQEKQKAMEAWERKLAAIMTADRGSKADNVIPLRPRKGEVQ